MLTYTYVSEGTFALMEKPKPVLQHERDAIVKVTLASICSSDLHIKHGSVPRAVPGITVGHEMVGIVEEVGSAVTNVKPGDRVTVNVETFCGECFFCKKGFVNNCTDQNGGWALGCRIDGGPVSYTHLDVYKRQEYTVSFLAYLIWDPVHMYNATTNGWTNFEHQITFDVRQPRCV